MDDVTEHPGASGSDGSGRRSWVRSVALVGGGLVAGGILAGTLTANAASDDTSATTAAPSYSQEDGDHQDGDHQDGDHGGPPAGTGDPSRPQRSDEQLLTGDTATKVTDAVLAEYPDATIERVETDSEGVYEGHLVTADGEHLIVQVGEDFAVTGTQSHG
jgi:hypothetical protein